MKAWLEQQVVTRWYHQPLVMLAPFSALYGLILTLRKLAYEQGWLKRYHGNIPVWVIGNLTVGGNGKTSCVLMMAQWLIAHGHKVGIVSRGYRSQVSRLGLTHEVTAGDTADQVGDEPLMLQQILGCPVVVAKQRAAAVKYLNEQQAVDIILADDGLQHEAMARDLEIIVVDNHKRFGNGHLLPRGPLREKISRLQSVDQVIYVGGDQTEQATLTPRVKAIRRCNHTLEMPLEQLKQYHVHALCGIGNPEGFYQLIDSLGCRSMQRYTFPDHHHYQRQDVDIPCGADEIILLTAKDAVKCQRWVDERHYVLEITMEPNACLQQWLSTLISNK